MSGRLPGVVAADERDDGGPAVRDRAGTARGARENAARPVEVPRDLGAQVAARLERLAEPRRARQQVDRRAGRRTRRARCASGIRSGASRARGLDDAQARLEGRNAARSVTCEQRAAARSRPACLSNIGRKCVGQEEHARQPERVQRVGERDARRATGAPNSSKGRVVPRPSERFVPSSRHIPG